MLMILTTDDQPLKMPPKLVNGYYPANIKGKAKIKGFCPTQNRELKDYVNDLFAILTTGEWVLLVVNETKFLTKFI